MSQIPNEQLAAVLKDLIAELSSLRKPADSITRDFESAIKDLRVSLYGNGQPGAIKSVTEIRTELNGLSKQFDEFKTETEKRLDRNSTKIEDVQRSANTQTQFTNTDLGNRIDEHDKWLRGAGWKLSGILLLQIIIPIAIWLITRKL